MQFLCLFSLNLQDLYEEGEYRLLEFWTWNSYIRDTYPTELQLTWNFTEIFYWIHKKYWKEEIMKETHRFPTRQQGVDALMPCVSCPPHLLYKLFCPKKFIKKTFGTKRCRLEAEPGQELFCSPAERFCQGYFPPGEENRSRWHHQRSSHHGRTNLHQRLHQHHLIANSSSSLIIISLSYNLKLVPVGC